MTSEVLLSAATCDCKQANKLERKKNWWCHSSKLEK